MNSIRRGVAVIVRSYSSSRSKPKPIPIPIPRPKEIPFQPKVSNSVNLIGQVGEPVQFQTAPDGNTWAATVITRQHATSTSTSSPYLWIPVIFQGDLAHTAFSHLKLNDFIHIAGQLTTDPPHLLPHTDVQVMVQTLNFVTGCPQPKNISAISDQEQQLSTPSASEKHDIDQSKEDFHSKQTEEHDIDKSWKDLLLNPNEWWDVRSMKEKPEGAAFERKTNGELLFINSSTPKWLQEKLELITIDLKSELKSSISVAKKDPDSSLSYWRDLLHDPKHWSDFRDSKLNGLVNPKFPDFKRKDSSVSLWLNRAPKWVLSELQGLEFGVPVVKSKQAKDGKGDQSWNDLLKNIDKWWDNRSNKRNERSPDFRHKETGEGLWLKDSPSWVLPKLPPLKPKQSVEIDRKQTLVSRGIGKGSRI